MPYFGQDVFKFVCRRFCCMLESVKKDFSLNIVLGILFLIVVEEKCNISFNQDLLFPKYVFKGRLLHKRLVSFVSGK